MPKIVRGCQQTEREKQNKSECFDSILLPRRVVGGRLSTLDSVSRKSVQRWQEWIPVRMRHHTCVAVLYTQYRDTLRDTSKGFWSIKEHKMSPRKKDSTYCTKGFRSRKDALPGDVDDIECTRIFTNINLTQYKTVCPSKADTCETPSMGTDAPI